MSLRLLFLLLVLSPVTVLAQSALILPFRSVEGGDEKLAETLSMVAYDDLSSAKDRRVDWLEVVDVPEITQVPANLYWETCEVDLETEVGCGIILGEAGAVEFVLLGQVGPPTGDSEPAQLHLRLLEIASVVVVADWSLPVESAEDHWVAQSVRLTIDQIRNPLPDPMAQQEELRRLQEEERERYLQAQREEARRDLDTDVSDEGLASDKRARQMARVSARLGRDELDAMERDGNPPWLDLGINRSQYRSYRNSGLGLDDWRDRDAGHRLQVLVGAGLALGAGPVSVKYYGAYINDSSLSTRVEQFSWQAVENKTSAAIEAFVGFGILRNLEVEFAFGAMPTNVQVKTVDAKLDDTDTYIDPPSVSLRLDEPFTAAITWVPFIEPRVRYYIFTVPRLKPSLGAGINMRFFPLPQDQVSFLCPSEGVANWQDCSSTNYDVLVKPWQLLSVMLEPGVMIELNRHAGLFVRLPITIATRPPLRWGQGIANGETFTCNTDEECQKSLQYLRNFEVPLGNGATQAYDATPDAFPRQSPFSIRFVIGIQGRLFGKNRRARYADDFVD